MLRAFALKSEDLNQISVKSCMNDRPSKWSLLLNRSRLNTGRKLEIKEKELVSVSCDCVSVMSGVLDMREDAVYVHTRFHRLYLAICAMYCVKLQA